MQATIDDIWQIAADNILAADDIQQQMTFQQQTFVVAAEENFPSANEGANQQAMIGLKLAGFHTDSTQIPPPLSAGPDII